MPKEVFIPKARPKGMVRVSQIIPEGQTKKKKLNKTSVLEEIIFHLGEINEQCDEMPSTLTEGFFALHPFYGPFDFYLPEFDLCELFVKTVSQINLPSGTVSFNAPKDDNPEESLNRSMRSTLRLTSQ